MRKRNLPVTEEDLQLARRIKIENSTNTDSELEYYSNMSFRMFLLAQETGIVVTENTNMIIVFDLLDNLESYINYKAEEQNKTLNEK